MKPCPVSQGALGPFSGSVRAPGARAASGAHHIRQVAERKISSTWSQVTPLAELNEMVQYTTNFCSGVDPPTHLSLSSPSFVQFAFSRRRVPSNPPVIAGPAQSRQAQLARNSVHTHEKCSSLRSAHEGNPNSRSVRKALFTTDTTLHFPNRSRISFRPISDAG